MLITDIDKPKERVQTDEEPKGISFATVATLMVAGATLVELVRPRVEVTHLTINQDLGVTES